MLKLYRLADTQAEASALVGVDDIERRQHVQQLTHATLAGCRQAGQPFTWIRAAGLRSIAAALSAGLQDGQALSAVLEATHSQVLEVLLSTLDRDLIPYNREVATLAAECWQQPTSGGGGVSSGSSGGGGGPEHAAQLLAAVGRYPAGYAPAAASAEELQEAFKVLQLLCLLHAKARALLCRSQYLQLITARACEAPGCLPAAMDGLLALLQGNEEAQAMFVTAGGLDMLLARTLEHAHVAPPGPAGPAPAPQAAAEPAAAAHARRSSFGGASGCDAGSDAIEDGCGLTRRQLLLQLLVFLQLLLHWVLGEAGAHPSTQQAAVSLMTRHLGPEAVAALQQGLGAAVADAGPEGGDLSCVLQRRAGAAAGHLHV